MSLQCYVHPEIIMAPCTGDKCTVQVPDFLLKAMAYKTKPKEGQTRDRFAWKCPVCKKASFVDVMVSRGKAVEWYEDGPHNDIVGPPVLKGGDGVDLVEKTSKLALGASRFGSSNIRSPVKAEKQRVEKMEEGQWKRPVWLCILLM
jgi:hypothetical protein